MMGRLSDAQWRGNQKAARFRRGKILDYVFLRVPAEWLGVFSTIEDSFGSDYGPLLGWIEFASTTAAPPATSSTYNGDCDRLVIVDVHVGGVRCIAA